MLLTALSHCAAVLLKFAVGIFLIFTVFMCIYAYFLIQDANIGVIIKYVWIICAAAIVLNVILLLLRGALSNLQKDLMMYVSDIKVDNRSDMANNDNINTGYLNAEFMTYDSEKSELDRLYEMGNISEQDYENKINTLNEKYKK